MQQQVTHNLPHNKRAHMHRDSKAYLSLLCSLRQPTSPAVKQSSQLVTLQCGTDSAAGIHMLPNSLHPCWPSMLMAVVKGPAIVRLKEALYLEPCLCLATTACQGQLCRPWEQPWQRLLGYMGTHILYRPAWAVRASVFIDAKAGCW